MKKSALLFLMLGLLFASCSESKKTEDPAESVEEVSNNYTLTAFDTSYDYPDAVLDNMNYTDGKFSFDVTSETYELGVQTPDAESKMCANSGQGQHIHLIVDNGPYAAKYIAEFEHDLEDGEHYILAFLSRSYHESIKRSSANVLKKVTIENKSITNSKDVSEAVLSYSRPKGTYVGKDTKKVMLDFYLSNVALDDGYTVEADINGEKHMIDTWQPYYIEGMEMGENTITLTLLKDGTKAGYTYESCLKNFYFKS